MTGCEEERWPLWRTRLQRRLPVFPGEGGQGESNVASLTFNLYLCQLRILTFNLENLDVISDILEYAYK